MRIYLSSENNEYICDFFVDKEKYKLEINGEKHDLFFKNIANQMFYSVDQLSWHKVTKLKSSKNIHLLNQTFKVHKGFKPSGKNGDEFGSLVTQMPGKVVKVLVKPGDKIEKGQTLLILEAMKMENEIKASAEASVKSVHVQEGESIESGHLMIELDQ
ncbi:MAG: acetyl-CoA carboxylase biotin carboxyl carrier protein subunit [Halobacteriovoraceae bacterium]|nr:acetyl-CoA carboxylase biotin carboxyl carrier protein subunit [Halobacteriovoraceae bacterium]